MESKTNKKAAVQFTSNRNAQQAFRKLGINDYTESDEDEKMFEVELTEKQWKELEKGKSIKYMSEL